MSNRKTIIRFFTIADYEEEEAWLHSQHQNGWKLAKMTPPCFYVFEECTPEDVAYRLDYQNDGETSNYFQLFRDYGWEYIGRCIGWLYFRKPSSETDCEQDREIFSDNESRIDMINHVLKTRFLPLMIIFLCCLCYILPTFIRNAEFRDPLATACTVFFAVLTLLYLYLLIYCGLKLQKLRKKYRND